MLLNLHIAMSLTKYSFSFNGKQLECWMIEIEGETWWRAADICKFIGCTHASRTVERAAVKSEWKKTYADLTCHTQIVIQSGLTISDQRVVQQKCIFINELGLLRLISFSNTPQSTALLEWVCQKLKASVELKISKQLELKNSELSVAKQDIIRKDQMIQEMMKGLIDANKQLTSAFSQMSDANQRMSEMMKDVVHKPSNPNQLHSIVLLKVNEKELRCLRRQKGSMEPALKKLKKTHPHLEELYRQDEVPNATNAWSVIKEEIAAMDPDTRFKFNRAFLKRLSSDVASIMEGLSNSKEIKILEI